MCYMNEELILNPVLINFCYTGFPLLRCLLCIGGISIKEQADRLKRYDDCLMHARNNKVLYQEGKALVPFPLPPTMNI